MSNLNATDKMFKLDFPGYHRWLLRKDLDIVRAWWSQNETYLHIRFNSDFRLRIYRRETDVLIIGYLGEYNVTRTQLSMSIEEFEAVLQ